MSRFRCIWLIARQDVRAASRSRQALLCAAVWLVLCAGAAWVGAVRHASHQAERASFQRQIRSQWESQPDRHPHRVAHYGSFAFRDVGPLSFFDPGVDSFVGLSVYQEAHRQNNANFSEAGHATSLVRFGELSLALVLQLLAPLLVFALCHASVAAERERGTWRQLRAHGVAEGQLLAGKLLGHLLVVLGSLGPGVLAASTILVVSIGPGQQGLLPRAALLLTSYATYIAVCVCLAVLISARQQTSRGALVALLATWVIVWVVAPRALPGVAEVLHPAASQMELDAAIARETRDFGDSHNPNDPRFAARRDALLREHNVERVQDLPFNYGGWLMQRAEEHAHEAYVRHHDALIETYREQDRVLKWAAVLSPYLAIRSLSAALAGTDFEHFVDFQRSAEQHRFAFIQRLNQLHTTEIAFANDRAQRLAASRWREFPPFEHHARGLAEVLEGQRLPAAALIGWSLLLAILLRRVRAPTSPS